jgi:hypothetical protein
MTQYNLVTYNQSGAITITPQGMNQPISGGGRYLTPAGYGETVRKIEVQGSDGSVNIVWNVNWYEPWRGSV